MSERTRTIFIVATAALFAFGVACTEIENIIPPTEPPIINIVPVNCNTNPNHVDCQDDDDDDEVEAIDVNGAWSGILSDQGAAIVATVWNGSLTHSGASFSGSWSTATGLVGSMNGAIEQDGRLSGGFTYTDAAGTCSGRLDGQASSSKMNFLVTGFLGSCAPVPTVLSVTANQ